ncbi:hydroxyacid dehydrogenase [Paenibacillus sp. H1-7]|uniref:hydroxyacid dehydrogenase n=1 Tax=Paenibacillus sp. H1-7 TaxID=2282849 RepID=UPI001EF8E216|nr:hydroxyacid dehydrogenase [Paenibacillus sp. H1-7]ULL16695.1 hydroxyacid dehydrogenase [Paenibacillus sp. H1-7]
MKMKAYVLPSKPLLEKICSTTCKEWLEEHFIPVWNETNEEYTPEQLMEIMADAEVILTSWGSPSISEEMLKKAPKLRYIGHAAGTVKQRIPKQAFGQGIGIYSAAPRLAWSVGEYCLSALLTLMRKLPQYDTNFRQGGWKLKHVRGNELFGKTIGIVSASSTGRAFIQLLKPFQVNILVYDPYLSEQRAEELGVRRATLEEVMDCPIISIHAPSIPATDNLVNADLIRRIKDGAILINSSRGAVLDEEVLFAELKTGRFYAALDVFIKNPSKDSSLRELSNVLVTPHVAGDTVDGHLALMDEIVADILRKERSEPTRFEVQEHLWDILA